MLYDAQDGIAGDGCVMSEKPWYLYLIECQDGSIYTGITLDVAARYAAHQNGTGARYTRSHPPKCLLAVIHYPDGIVKLTSISLAEMGERDKMGNEKRSLVSP